MDAETENDAEILAMREITRVLSKLSPEQAMRVGRWVADRYSGAVVRVLPKQPSAGAEDGVREGDSGDLPGLFEAAKPTTESEKLLVAGYWYQRVKRQKDLDSQQLNTDLKQLGHGVSNVTRAFQTLIEQRPQLAIQTKKQGSSRQARKRYRITSEGMRVVEAMVRGEVNGDEREQGSA